MPVPDPWFSAVIAEGLQRLAAMHLVGTPTDAGLDLACAVWIDTLWYRRGSASGSTHAHRPPA